MQHSIQHTGGHPRSIRARTGQRWRSLRLVAVLAATALVLAACAPDEELSGEGGGDGDTSGPIKIGFISPHTGAVAAAGQDMRDGWAMYWEEQGNEVAGRQVETIFEDDAGNPDTGRTKAQKLVQSDDVSMTVGPIHANIGYVVADYVSGQGLPSIMAVAAADDLTQRETDPLVLRTGAMTSSQVTFPAGQWAIDQGYKTAVTLCPDYAFGHESCGGFVRTFTEGGGEILNQLWNPLNTQDFSTYANQIRQADPDVLFVTATGADTARIVSAYRDFGLDDIPLIGNGTLLEQATLRGMGTEAEGLQSFSYFAEGWDNPATQEFVEAYEAEFDLIPSLYSAGAYVTANWVHLALEELEGDASDAEALVEAMKGIELEDSPMGPLSLDENGQIVGNVYLRTVTAREDGTMWNTVDEVIPDVSQFWTYDPEEYMSEPVYTREFQGAAE